MDLEPEILLLFLLLLDPPLGLLELRLSRLDLLLLHRELLVIRIVCLIALLGRFPDPLLDRLDLQEERLVVGVLLLELVDLTLEVDDQQVLLLACQLEGGGCVLRET